MGGEARGGNSGQIMKALVCHHPQELSVLLNGRKEPWKCSLKGIANSDSLCRKDTLLCPGYIRGKQGSGLETGMGDELGS